MCKKGCFNYTRGLGLGLGLGLGGETKSPVFFVLVYLVNTLVLRLRFVGGFINACSVLRVMAPAVATNSCSVLRVTAPCNLRCDRLRGRVGLSSMESGFWSWVAGVAVCSCCGDPCGVGCVEPRLRLVPFGLFPAAAERCGCRLVPRTGRRAEPLGLSGSSSLSEQKCAWWARSCALSSVGSAVSGTGFVDLAVRGACWGPAAVAVSAAAGAWELSLRLLKLGRSASVGMGRVAARGGSITDTKCPSRSLTVTSCGRPP
eukprot:SAG31_NODE_1636_length_7681_cov_4.278423_5_plen_259_part_00